MSLHSKKLQTVPLMSVKVWRLIQENEDTRRDWFRFLYCWETVASWETVPLFHYTGDHCDYILLWVFAMVAKYVCHITIKLKKLYSSHTSLEIGKKQQQQKKQRSCKSYISFILHATVVTVTPILDVLSLKLQHFITWKYFGSLENHISLKFSLI